MIVYLLISLSYDSKKDRISTKCLRGIYTSLEAAIDSIVQYPDSISEGGYFNYILVEERNVNALDGHSVSEHWYQFILTLGDNILIEKIEKPEIFSNLFNFV